tara:strand:- start:28520 stop:28696 length:177 start_codon:yes stop_codon:yes gene_type:complete
LEKILDLTLNNPIFISVMILVIWFAPGIIVRRIAEKNYIERKEAEQAKKISRLYPKDP